MPSKWQATTQTSHTGVTHYSPFFPYNSAWGALCQETLSLGPLLIPLGKVSTH